VESKFVRVAAISNIDIGKKTKVTVGTIHLIQKLYFQTYEVILGSYHVNDQTMVRKFSYEGSF
jgi:hypothetical protein